jgi:hypothetical protein
MFVPAGGFTGYTCPEVGLGGKESNATVPLTTDNWFYPWLEIMNC